MENISVKGMEVLRRDIEVSVNPLDVLNSLKKTICKVSTDTYISNDGDVESKTDVSYHGSPCYEYTTYDLTYEQRELLQTINHLKDLLRKQGFYTNES